jgi:uncharacterized protein involved in exopolysaccharide biosynthesis
MNELTVEESHDTKVDSGLKAWQGGSDLARHLRSRAKQILFWTIIGTVIAGALTVKICKYGATAQIMPPDSSGGGLEALALPALAKSPGLAGLAGLAGGLLGTKSTGALFTKVLLSRTVEDSLIDHFNLRHRYHVKYWEDARDKLESRTTIAEDKKSGVISISVRDRDADFAAKLTNAYVAELDHVMLQVATSAARRERVFIEQRLGEEKKNLEDAEQRFSKFASSSMALDIPQQTRVMVESAARLQGELIAARAEMEGLEQIYTGENTRVRTVQARVNELQRALDRINTGADKTEAGNGSNPYPSVKKLPIVGLEWTDLYRNTKIHETVYELLTQQYEVARIQEAREIPTVKVLDPAVAPEKRHPSPTMVIAVGALLSMLLACVGQSLHYAWGKWDADDPRRMFLASMVPQWKRKGSRSAELD